MGYALLRITDVAICHVAFHERDVLNVPMRPLSRGRSALRLTLAPLLLAAAACGTTVPSDLAGSAAAQGDGVGLSPGGPALQDATSPAGVDSAAPSGSGGAPSSQGGNGAAGQPGAQGRPSTVAPGATTGTRATLGRGVTASAINIGVMYIDPNAGRAAQAIGANGADTGDGRAVAEAVIADINTRGINGRTLKPAWYSNDVTSTQSQGQQMQVACDAFMQDHNAFAVVGLGHQALAECVEKRGGVTVDATFGVVGLDRARLAALPHTVNVSAMAVDRAAEALVPALVDQNWFAGWNTALGAPGPAPVRVGVISYDDPYFRRAIERNLKPALAAAGHPAVVTEYVNHHQSLSDLSGQTTQVQSAVLKFASEGVTHVVNFDDNGTIGLFLTNAAESQGYRPRYGVTTGSEFQYLVQSGSVPREQLSGALGIGWHTILDVPYQDWLSDKHASASRKRCGAVLAKANVRVGGVFAATLAAGLCDSLYTLEATMRQAGSALSRDTYRATLAGFGDAYQSAATPGTSLSADRRDGAARYFHWGFDAQCTCMTYRGAPRQAP